MYVVVNAAMSADGKLSTRRREQVAISGSSDFDRVDRLRAENDAVMVGIGTVLADDPRLTVADETRRRERVDGGRSANPIRVVADSRARTPTDARILNDDATSVVLVSEDAPVERRDALAAAGAHVVLAGAKRVDLSAAVEKLPAFGVENLMVEGGGELVFSLFEANLVDELSVFLGPRIIGGREAPTLVDGGGFVDPDEFPTLSLDDFERVDEGILLRWSVSSRCADGRAPVER